MSKEQTQTSDCRGCGEELSRGTIMWQDKTKSNTRKLCRTCYNKQVAERRHKKRKANRDNLREYLGGEFKCNRCGFTHNTTSPFAWHHEKENKDINPGNIITANWETLKKEIDKCEFLCHNCHMIHHHD